MDLSWLLPTIKGIPVLMYHRVWPGTADDLTITPEALRAQWQYLKQEGYEALSLPGYLDIISGNAPVPHKAVLLTFDDGYYNNLQYACPLLKELGFKATFFIIGNSLDESFVNESSELLKKMLIADLRSLDTDVVSLAMHGYEHKNFGKISMLEIKEEVSKAIAAFDNSKLLYHKVWAYAYGGRPADMKNMRQILGEAGINAAFRIGNRVSEVPVKDVYEIKRIDIKGTDTMEEFRIKMKKGKLKPF